MRAQDHQFRAIVCISLTMLVAACGKPMQSATNASLSQSNTPLDTQPVSEKDLQDMQKKSQVVDQAMTQIDSTFSQFFDRQGNMAFNLSQLFNRPQGGSGFLVGAIEPVLMQAVGKIAEARGKIDEARAKIADLLNQLNVTIPEQQQMKEKLMKMLSRMDVIDDKIVVAKSFLLAKIDVIYGKLDKALAKLPTLAQILLSGEVESLKNLLLRVKELLQTL